MVEITKLLLAAHSLALEEAAQPWSFLDCQDLEVAVAAMMTGAMTMAMMIQITKAGRCVSFLSNHAPRCWGATPSSFLCSFCTKVI